MLVLSSAKEAFHAIESLGGGGDMRLHEYNESIWKHFLIYICWKLNRLWFLQMYSLRAMDGMQFTNEWQNYRM